MADTYGSLSLPVTETDPAGDPALARLGAYVKAVVNAQCAAAWLAARPATGTVEPFPVKFALVVNPEEEGFNEKHLPALYIYREDGTFGQDADDRRVQESHIRLLWVLPPAVQAHAALRKPFFNAVACAIDDALERGRDPVWADAGDPDVLAATIAADTDSLVLATATSLAPVTYSGATLTGTRAGSDFAPRLAPTVTTAATTVDAYNITDPIVWTGVDWYGRTRTWTRTLTAARGGETLTVPEDVASITSIARPAQLSTAGSMQFGTAAFTGRGSVIRTRCGFATLTTGKWTRTRVQVDAYDPVERASLPTKFYPALLFPLTVTEKRTTDLANTARFLPLTYPRCVDIDTVEDDVTLAQRSLPDA